MVHGSVEVRIREIALAAVKRHSLEFVHLEFAGTKRNPVFRIFIDKPNGVTIEDCSAVSRTIEAELDADAGIPGPFVLEVSSPGLDRQLYSLADFERFKGHLAKLKMRPDFDGEKTLIGRIVSIRNGSIDLDIGKDETRTVPYESVLKANLKIDLREELKRG